MHYNKDMTPEQRVIYNAWQRERNREQGDTRRVKRNAHYRRNRDRFVPAMKVRNLMRRYGITPEQHAQMFADQNGACAICLATDKRLCVDHCHRTSKVRGLLCVTCNVWLGVLEDAEFGANATAYLERTI